MNSGTIVRRRRGWTIENRWRDVEVGGRTVRVSEYRFVGQALLELA